MQLAHKKNFLFAAIWLITSSLVLLALHYLPFGYLGDLRIPSHDKYSINILSLFAGLLVGIVIPIIILKISQLSLSQRDRIEIPLLITIFYFIYHFVHPFVVHMLYYRETTATSVYVTSLLKSAYLCGVLFILSWIFLTITYLLYQRHFVQR